MAWKAPGNHLLDIEKHAVDSDRALQVDEEAQQQQDLIIVARHLRLFLCDGELSKRAFREQLLVDFGVTYG